MKTLTSKLPTRTADLGPGTLTPTSGSPTSPASGPDIRDVLDMRVGCWRPPVHVTLS